MMPQVFSIVVEPADYTRDLVRAIYLPRKVDYAYLFGRSEASGRAADPVAPVLSRMPFRGRFLFLWRQLKTHDIFVVNGYTDLTNVFFFLLNALFFRKALAIESDTELRIPRNGLKRLLKAFFLHILFRRKWCYGFSGGDYGHRELFRHYGMAEERIFLMPMMVDVEKYKRAGPPASSDGVFRFIFLGRLVPHKQVGRILEAFGRVVLRYPAARLDIVGSGEDRGRLESEAAEIPGVVFHGAVYGEKKVGLLHRASCLILYSYYEPWGLVVNEALASGIPCIVSDRVGARNDLILGDRPTGSVVPWNSAEALADAMMSMMSDPGRYEILRANAEARMAVWNYDLYGASFDSFLRKVSDYRL